MTVVDSRPGGAEARPAATTRAGGAAPLRVLLVTEASAAGVGRHVVDLAEGLLERGHVVHLAYSPARIDRPFEEGLARLEVGTTHAIPMRRGPHPGDLRALRALRRVLREHGPFDVAHAHSTKAGLLVRTLPSLGGARVAYTPHCIYTMNPDLGRPARAVARAIEVTLARRTDALIAVSPDEGEHVRGLGLRADRVNVVPNGVAPLESDRGGLRRALGFAADELVVGFVGRLCAQKDPGLLLEAFARLRGDHPRARLAMVGDGPLRHALHRRGARLELGDRVRWLGARPAAAVMPAFDVLALPSRYEGLPYVLLEALAAGLPIVATDVGGVRLAVEEGENGYVVPCGVADRFADALASLLADPARRERAGRAARARAPRFSIAEMVARTEAIYRRLTPPNVA